MTPLKPEEISDRLGDLEGWSFEDNCLQTTLEFEDFREAFTFMTRIAFECEQLNHHPDWTNVYKTLEIRLNTHDAGGVTDKDFQLAQRIEALVNTQP